MPVYTKLMQHQDNIVKFCANKDYAGIFAEYGTGKTLCALKLAEVTGCSKILVVCSKTAILTTWPSEISKHTDFRYVYLTGVKNARLTALNMGLRQARTVETAYSAESLKPVFFLINFDGIKSIYNELKISSFDMLIVDESTKIKSASTERTKIMWALGKDIPRRYIMTGWPITESVQDLYSQIKFLDFGEALGSNYFAFMNKYFMKYGYKWLPKKDAIEDVLNKIKQFCIRVKSSDVLDLPPKRYLKYHLEPTDEQTKLLNQLNSEFRLVFNGVKIDTQYVFALLAKSLQICDGFIKDNWHTKYVDYDANTVTLTCTKCNMAKVYDKEDFKAAPIRCDNCHHQGNYALVETEKDKALLEILEEIDVHKHKVIIWTPFKFTILKLSKILEKEGHNVLILTGDTSDVKSVVDKFMTSKVHNLLLLTEKKASESLNLIECNIAIYYSNEYSYDKRANSEARIYRKGSEMHSSVIYIDLITKGTIEEDVYTCLTEKKSLVDSLKATFSGEK